jgi:hypothetical protein
VHAGPFLSVNNLDSRKTKLLVPGMPRKLHLITALNCKRGMTVRGAEIACHGSQILKAIRQMGLKQR